MLKCCIYEIDTCDVCHESSYRNTCFRHVLVLKKIWQKKYELVEKKYELVENFENAGYPWLFILDALMKYAVLIAFP